MSSYSQPGQLVGSVDTNSGVSDCIGWCVLVRNVWTQLAMSTAYSNGSVSLSRQYRDLLRQWFAALRCLRPNPFSGYGPAQFGGEVFPRCSYKLFNGINATTFFDICDRVGFIRVMLSLPVCAVNVTKSRQCHHSIWRFPIALLLWIPLFPIMTLVVTIDHFNNYCLGSHNGAKTALLGSC